jgi:4-diphosphocytidyl-2-C-methyl-D-erythritol kinase
MSLRTAQGWDNSMTPPLTPAPQFHPAGPDSLFGWTPAKVNLFLEVLGKRADGYHEVETLIVAVNLYDSLEATRLGDGQLLLTCNNSSIPTGPTNLVVKAAEALREATGCQLGAKLHLTKRIPHEAGLGGGSSDAALTLVMLNQLWKLQLPVAKLIELAAKLGSDIGAFLAGQAAWCTGRGEVVTPVTLPAPLHLVIVKPPFGLSTKAVYAQHIPPSNRVTWDRNNFNHLHNRLEAPAFAAEPRVKIVHDELRRAGSQAVLVSGSGSCVFGLAQDATDARRIATQYEITATTKDSQVFVVRSL